MQTWMMRIMMMMMKVVVMRHVFVFCFYFSQIVRTRQKIQQVNNEGLGKLRKEREEYY